MRIFKRSLQVLAMSILLNGCASIAYYAQSISGQLHVLHSREAIEQRLQEPTLPAQHRSRLEQIQELKRFAVQELALPDSDSYTDIVTLEQDYVVWNVIATPEFSLQAKHWCFPVAGCLSYRGYFLESAARDYAEHLQEQGLDVFVSGVAAYSTLGWFDDPLLSTMLDWSDARFAEVILHELSHQKVYLPDDTAFNEAYATTVGKIGSRLWLHRHASTRDLIDLYHQQAYDAGFTRLLLEVRGRLRQLYGQDLSVPAMRSAKAHLLSQLEPLHDKLRQQHPQASHYDQWFLQETNNARLALVSTYHRHTAAFEALWQIVQGNWADFHQRVASIGALPKPQRARCLQLLRQEDSSLSGLAAAGCLP